MWLYIYTILLFMLKFKKTIHLQLFSSYQDVKENNLDMVLAFNGSLNTTRQNFDGPF